MSSIETAQREGFDQALTVLYEQARSHRRILVPAGGPSDRDESLQRSRSYVSIMGMIEKLEGRRVELFGAESGMTELTETENGISR